MRGWNKCDDCGRFARPEELMFEEVKELRFGVLFESYPSVAQGRVRV